MIKKLFGFALLGLLTFMAVSAVAETTDYKLGPGDSIRITVFQNPDLTLETRVSESGSISFPLIGTVQVGGLSTIQAEKQIADKLKSGNYVKRPQVSITLLEVRGSQLSVVGMVGKPGRYPLEASSARLSDVIAQAGGVLPEAGGGTAVITGLRDGKPFHKEVDLASLFNGENSKLDLMLRSGDAVYVTSGNQVSVLGMVNKPGRYPLDNTEMRLTDALSLAGGMMQEASDTVIVSGQRDGKPFRKEVDLAGIYLSDKSDENVMVRAGDEIYVHRAPVFYIYGEAQKPGAYRIERNMTVIQALAQGGGPTTRGTERNIKLLRRTQNGSQEMNPKMTDLVRPDDVLYVRESLF